MVRDNDNIVNLMRLRPQESELIGAVMKPFVVEISGWHRSRMCRVEIDNRMFQYLDKTFGC